MITFSTPPPAYAHGSSEQTLATHDIEVDVVAQEGFESQGKWLDNGRAIQNASQDDYPDRIRRSPNRFRKRWRHSGLTRWRSLTSAMGRPNGEEVQELRNNHCRAGLGFWLGDMCSKAGPATVRYPHPRREMDEDSVRLASLLISRLELIMVIYVP